jgi:uncharacterized protein (TIGR00290 family)
MKKSILSWSGGKDSVHALSRILNEKEYHVACLLTLVSEEYERVSMHGVRTSLLDKQIMRIGIPLQKILLPETTTMESYDIAIGERFSRFREEGITHCICGDIFLEDLREYREKQLTKVGLKAVFPLWKIDSRKLVNGFIDAGFKAIVTCVDERYLDKSFCGREINNDFINDLPENVDPCGENGEYHSFVFDGPLFSEPVKFSKGELVYKKYKSHSTDDQDKNIENGFWFCDLNDN